MSIKQSYYNNRDYIKKNNKEIVLSSPDCYKNMSTSPLPLQTEKKNYITDDIISKTNKNGLLNY